MDGDVSVSTMKPLQKYDEYKCNGTDILLQGTAAATHAKAIFPGNFVYYAGYDKANDDVIAVTKILPELSFQGTDNTSTSKLVETEKGSGYVSLLPQWGDVTSEDAEKLKVDLKWLTGIAKFTVYKGGATKIRVVAAAEGQTATTIAGLSTNALTGAYVDANTPLAGYFEAQLKKDGVLKKTNNALVEATDNYKSYIEVDLNGNTADSIHVYVPIIPASYANLMFQVYEGTTWVTKALTSKGYSTYQPRWYLLLKPLVSGDQPISAQASTLAELNTVLGVIKSNASYTGKPVNIQLTGEGNSVSTIDDADPTKQTLEIPAFGANQILSIKGSIKNVAPNRPLIIKNTATAGTVTLNLTVEGTENVEIKEQCRWWSPADR